MNLLSTEQSAYLRSAAHQPVHWNPWGARAFERAASEDKPVLLDIGAVWCHWCHVMDMESYENDSIAKLINERFIAIKVDRDERPDIDTRYQAAVSAISGQGGWPLTAFLTPEGKVFYGGTYFPPEDRYGRAGFPKVLAIIADTYRNERDKALRNAEEIDRLVKNYLGRQSDPAELSEELLDSALNSIAREFDAVNGGFGKAPKFPHPSAIELLLSRYDHTREQWMLAAATKNLRAMANGGVHDQLGGGFHRYSTDEKWIVPHFEKMLYDNAPLLKNYTDAFQATSDPFYQDVALDIIRYTREVLSDAERGGFYASQDADVEFGDDGSYFTWTLAETEQILSPEELEVMKLHYNIHERGEMHHDDRQNVLFVEHSGEQIAGLLKKPLQEVGRLIESGKQKMRQARLLRKAPFVDTTVYASWNGMMISAFLHAYRAFGDADLMSFALQSLERIIAEHTTDAGLISHRAMRIAGDAFLDDQVEILQALLDAYEVTGEERYLARAESLAKTTIEKFRDAEAAGFTDIPASENALGALTITNKPIQDSPTAGANAVAIISLLRLYTITEKSAYRETAEQALRFFAGSVRNHGIFAATYFLGLDLFLHPPLHIVVVSPQDDVSGTALFRSALSLYKPNAVVTRVDPRSAENLPSPVKEMAASYTRPTAYVCSNFVCSAAVHDISSLTETVHLFNRTMETSR